MSNSLLSLQEYHELYSSRSDYEFWFGEVVRKSAPTWVHAILQALLAEIFTRAEYSAGSELELRIDPEWEPRPDVAAAFHVEHPYPTKPIEIVAEVLSPDDPMQSVHVKCANYARTGIHQIFVFDPDGRIAWEWDRNEQNLQRIAVLHLSNGVTIAIDEIWSELDRRVHPLRK